MDAYPSFAQLVSSTMDLVDDRMVDRAVGGEPRARAMFDAAKYRFVVQHKLSVANVAALLSFYASHRAAEFTFTWNFDASSHTVIFDSAPPKVTPVSGVEAAVEVVLVTV